ncbi:patatin-like phospholipase family protein [Taklimakanibacter deserti]|uniref:patatin-like phospholipase family protein n=1 Tax=Taklimakanibacter deserti TaxID=2267839 RepID=UPI0013C42E73
MAGACASSDALRDPVPKGLVDRATVDNLEGIRFWGDAPPGTYRSIAEARIAQLEKKYGASGLKGKKVAVESLSLSGGGDDGAFGAGLLVGWSESGTRPEFEIVTGISTGSMIAPMAFLGPRYDGMLKEAYTTVSSKQLVKTQVLSALLGSSDGLADPRPLANMIARYTSQKMLEEIAAEYRKGRFLLIGTTNLDAQRPVIWDIGALANSGRPDALQLMRKIILASASVPGALPPVELKVAADGKFYDEMHVDGGVTRQVFLYPPGFEPEIIDEALGWKPARRAYIIRNGKVSPEFAVTKAKLLPITSRSISTLIKTQGVGDLYQIYLTTKRDRVDYNLTYIPADFAMQSKSAFDKAYMNALFKLGYSLGRAGMKWEKSPPGWE